MNPRLQTVFESGFMAVFLFVVSGGQSLLVSLVEGSGYVVNTNSAQRNAVGYPVQDYALYTVLTAAIVGLGCLILLTMNRNPSVRNIRYLFPCLVLMVIAMLWIILAEGGL